MKKYFDNIRLKELFQNWKSLLNKFLKKEQYRFFKAFKKSTFDEGKHFKKKFGILLDLSTDGIIFTEGFRIVEANPAILKLLNYDKNEFIGKNLKEIIVPKSIVRKRAQVYYIKLKTALNVILSFEITFKKIDPIHNVIYIRKPVISENNLLIKAILDAEDRERQYFSSEIHDGIGPALTVLQIYFQWLAESSEENRDFIIEKGNQYFTETINLIKEISYKNNPTVVENYGMIKAIETFIYKINLAQKLKINFIYNIKTRFNIQLEVAIYRIASELINNTLRYAEATNIDLNINYEMKNNLLQLHYVDNGKGLNFNAASSSKLSFGINNIRKRIHALKGKFEFKNNNLQGIEIVISLPVFFHNM